MKLLGTAAVLLVLKLKSTQASEPGMNCIDKETGLCELEGLFTYCYLNVDTGEYNCDKDNKCAAKSETLRTMTGGGGCFGTNCPVNRQKIRRCVTTLSIRPPEFSTRRM